MKRIFWAAAAAAALLTASGPGWAAEEEKVAVSASLGVFNRYVFRGYELSSRSLVFQPSLGAGYKGFCASFWGNIDSDERATQTLAPDRPGRRSFNEVDLTLSYTHGLGKLELTGGYIYYGTKYTDETEELYLSVAYDTFAKPTLAVYRDITRYPGTYINLSFSQSWKVYREATLDLGASVAYFAGDGEFWKTYDSSTGAYTGEKYRAFHDGRATAGLTLPWGKNLAFQPTVSYWLPLSGKAARTVNGSSYNRNGHLDENWVAGINLKFSY